MGITPDFQVLYLAAKDFLSGLNFYQNKEMFTGVGYPPITLLFYTPLTIFSYPTSQTIFFVLNLVLIAATIYLSFKIVHQKPKTWHFLFALSLALISFPTKFTLGMGQNNLISLFLILISFYAYKKGGNLRAGIFLGLAISLKTIFGFFLLFYLIKKKYKLLAYTFITIAVLFTISILIGGIGLYGYYFEKVVPPLLNLAGREIYYNQGLMGFISRLTQDNNLRKIFWEIGSFALIAITSFKTLITKNENLAFSLFIITLLLIDSLSWQHHFVWLIFPFIVIGKEVLRRKRAILTSLFILSYSLISWNFKNPSLNFEVLNPLLLSHVFIGALVLYLLNSVLPEKQVTS